MCSYLDMLEGRNVQTELHEIVYSNDVEACKELLQTARGMEMLDKTDYGGFTALIFASRDGFVEIVSLLLKAGADTTPSVPHGLTALHRAARRGRVKCVELLIQASADLDAVSEYHSTPLGEAAKWGQRECFDMLVKAGATVNKIGEDGSTQLHAAASCTGPGLVWLLEAGVTDVDAVNSEGETALHVAIKERLPGPVALLAAAVARLEVPPALWQLSPRDQDLLIAIGGQSWARDDAERRLQRRPATMAAVQHEARWRRRRPLALIREQRLAARDAVLVHKQWEKRQEEAEEAEQTMPGSGGS